MRASIRARSRARRARLHRRPRQSRCLSVRRCSSALYQLYFFDLLICIIWDSTLYFSFLLFNSTSYFLFFFFLSVLPRIDLTIIVIASQSSCPPPIYSFTNIQWRTAECYFGSTQSTFDFHFHFSHIFAGEGSASLFPASCYAFLTVVNLATVQGILS